MFRFLLKISFDGTDFHGWQVQDNAPTVQQCLCEKLSLMLKTPINVTGCSRTDAGVHANEFCLVLENHGGTIPADKLPVAVSRYLPPDHSLYYAEECTEDFHPRYDVKSKEYLYRIINDKIFDPFDYERAWFVPRNIDDAAIERMRAAARHLLGAHDFTAFTSSECDVLEKVRNVYYITVDKVGKEINIRICADGFLYNMVRIIVGTLIEVANGRFSPDYVLKTLESKNRNLAGMTAPAYGLYLNKVTY